MNCSRCELSLQRGSCHVNEEACIEGLKAALEEARSCSECRQPVLVVLHPQCVPATMAKRATQHGVGIVEKKIGDAITDFLAGGKKRKRRERDEEDEDRKQERGDRFEP